MPDAAGEPALATQGDDRVTAGSPRHPIRHHILRFFAACGFAMSILISMSIHSSALATQHLITPGDDWQKFSGKLKAGDEIILMPGKHRSATLDDLAGTADQPITIRGLEGQTPSIIDGQRDGLRLNRPHHVVIKDLTISDCALGGISVSDGVVVPPASRPDDPETLGPIAISNVKILRIGLRMDRDAISLIGVDTVKIDRCQIEGWNSCGIELVGCHDASIDHCTFKPAEGFTPLCGIAARAGSERLQIRDCRFESAGKRVLCMGGNSKIEHFRPRLTAEAKPASRAEAAHIVIDNCFILNGQLPLALINVDDCIVQNCTVVRPRAAVLAVLSEQIDPRILSGRSITFGSNLITWEPGEIQKLADVHKTILDNAIQWQSNLWWSAQSPADREKLGTLPGKTNWPQIFDVDPKLDEQFKPAEERAAEFGVRQP